MEHPADRPRGQSVGCPGRHDNVPYVDTVLMVLEAMSSPVVLGEQEENWRQILCPGKGGSACEEG